MSQMTTIEEKRDNTLYTTREAAQLMKLSPSTLVSWREGRGTTTLPFVKLGRAIRYRHADVMALIQANTFKNLAESGH